MEDEIRTASTPRRRAPRNKVAASPPGTGNTPGGDDGAIGEDSKATPPVRQGATSGESRVEAGTITDLEMGPEERELEDLLASASSVRDLERLASDNPRTAVLGALAVGFLIGFGVGLLAAKD